VLQDGDFLGFVRDRMVMSGPYQPLIIGALIAAGGTLTKRELAQQILLADELQQRHAERILMRWPLDTLRKHGVIAYERHSMVFRLSVELTPEEAAEVVAVCDQRMKAWNRNAAPKRASRFYRVIDLAGGRCQACGVLGIDRALDIDHVIPQDRANSRGEVQLPSGEWARSMMTGICRRCATYATAGNAIRQTQTSAPP
jgi:ATP adenylyltransferase